MRTASFLLLGSVLFAAPAAARQTTLGIYGLWGAFHEPGRCWAISQPSRVHEDAPPAFASVGAWPARGISGQVHIRLSREKREGSAVLLRIDGRTFQLRGGGRDAWAPDAAADAAILESMRTGIAMTVETRSATGARILDQYRLQGAASAIDAALIACARRR